MTIHMFRYMHFSEEALGKSFGDLLRNSDILFAECVAKENYANAIAYYNDISTKGYSTHKLNYGDLQGFENVYHSFISQSGKPVVVERSPITFAEASKWEDMCEAAKDTFFNGRFDEAYERGLKETRYFLEMNKRREDCLEQQLIETQNDNPRKTIFFPIGGAHLVYLKLKNKGVDVKQTLGYKPLTFDNRTEFMRRTIFGLESPPELIGRIFTDDTIFTYLHKMGTPLFENFDRTRRASDKVSMSMLKELSKHIASDVTRKRYPTEASILWLKKRGIEV